MKEITFEELIIRLFPNHELTKDRWSFELMQFSADDLIEFGKQVREATIAECVEILKNPNIPKIDFLDTKIDDCDLSIRTKNICRMNDFKVIRDLIAYSTKDLMMLHFGKRTISEIQELLISKGYSFGS